MAHHLRQIHASRQEFQLQVYPLAPRFASDDRAADHLGWSATYKSLFCNADHQHQKYKTSLRLSATLRHQELHDTLNFLHRMKRHPALSSHTPNESLRSSAAQAIASFAQVYQRAQELPCCPYPVHCNLNIQKQLGFCRVQPRCRHSQDSISLVQFLNSVRKNSIIRWLWLWPSPIQAVQVDPCRIAIDLDDLRQV